MNDNTQKEAKNMLANYLAKKGAGGGPGGKQQEAFEIVI